MRRNTLGPTARSWYVLAAALPLLACDSSVEINVNINATAPGNTSGESSSTGDESSSSGDESSSSTGDFCPEDQVECDGLLAQVCDGMGGYKSSTACDIGCVEPVGCSACIPGATRCVGDSSEVCAPDGSAWQLAQDCDDVQDLACDPDTGLCAGACAGLERSDPGCDFYPVVTRQYDGVIDLVHPFAVAVVNTSGASAEITVTRGDDPVDTEVVADGASTVITLPWVDDLARDNGGSQVVVDGAYRLRSTRPVTVYQYNPLLPDITGDASLLLPVHAWTGNALVASRPHWLDFHGWYSVTASADDTTVTLTAPGGGAPTQTGGGVDVDGNGVVVLDAGDVLQVLTLAGGDPTGAIVSADKPVQVHGGHECTQVPVGMGYCDHLEESIPPTETLATQYVVTPPVQQDGVSPKAMVVRIVAAAANTSLTFEPDQVVDHVLDDAGDHVEVPIGVDTFVVTADRPILVAQYMVGADFGYGNADPSMTITTPAAQFRTNYGFYAQPDWPFNFVDIVAPTGASVVLDGDPVASFAAIGASGFSVAHVPLDATGGHSITADQAVGISVYGLAPSTSYWYPGGQNLEILP